MLSKRFWLNLLNLFDKKFRPRSTLKPHWEVVMSPDMISCKVSMPILFDVPIIRSHSTKTYVKLDVQHVIRLNSYPIAVIECTTRSTLLFLLLHRSDHWQFGIVNLSRFRYIRTIRTRTAHLFADTCIGCKLHQKAVFFYSMGESKEVFPNFSVTLWPKSTIETLLSPLELDFDTTLKILFDIVYTLGASRFQSFSIQLIR